MAKSFWDVREEFEFVAPVASLEESLNKAIASKKQPFIISDMGDNPTAGGAGDVTWTLQEVLKRKEFQKEDGTSLIYASIPGPKFVEKAIELGEGAKIEAFAGANVDARYAGPVKLKGTIEKIKHGDKHAETEVVVKVCSVHVIVTKIRKPYHHEADFTNLDLNPRKTDIVMVKIGYLDLQRVPISFILLVLIKASFNLLVSGNFYQPILRARKYIQVVFPYFFW